MEGHFFVHAIQVDLYTPVVLSSQLYTYTLHTRDPKLTLLAT
jgi:hypothetical protein